MRILAGLFVWFSFAIAAPLHAQMATQCPDCLSVEAAREDLRVLYETLQQEHVDLFARRTREEYDAHINRLVESIAQPITPQEFHLVLQDAMSFGKIGHAKTEAPLADVMGHVQAGGGIIPLSVSYREAEMMTDNWSTAEGDAFPPGSTITRLGGLTTAQFEDRLGTVISADTQRLLRSQIELLMPACVYFVFGPVEALKVEYVDPEGKSGSMVLNAMGLQDMYAMQDARALPRPIGGSSERAYSDLGGSVFYLKPGPFYATPEERGESDDDYKIGPFKAFVAEAFADLSASGASNLIIDIRNNPGGDASFSDLIIARLTDRPYVFASRYEIRAGAKTKEGWSDRNDEPGTLLARISEAISTAGVGERVSVDLPEVRPIEDNAFRGRVWVLIDKHSYSNAAVIAAVMQDLEIATIVGEETADLATTYGAVERFTLPNSGAQITYPKAYMVRPSGDETVRGVVPDVAIEPNPIGHTADKMLEEVVTRARASN